jgi:hypothetical protein
MSPEDLRMDIVDRCPRTAHASFMEPCLLLIGIIAASKPNRCRGLRSDEVRIRKDGSFEVKFEVCAGRELNPFCDFVHVMQSPFSAMTR